ncbi:MAG: response regulator [Flavobacteriales bacterium]|nr:response regulator [Flavobacteriales bacterium]
MTNKKKKKIFIVDDDNIYLEFIKHELSEVSNIEIETFQSAEKCLENMYKKPQLIILDYNLDSIYKDNISGHNALSILQKRKPQPEIIYISSSSNEGLLEEYQRYRKIDFVLKTNEGSKFLIPTVLRKLNAA